MATRLSIIIPCYNEEKTVLEILERLVAVPDLAGPDVQFIVVNDGSTDSTKKLLEASLLRGDKRFVFLNHEKNMGKGTATRTGIRRAEGVYTIIQDADLEYDPKDIIKLLHKAEAGNLPVVYGSRNKDPKTPHGTFFFYWGGRFVTLVTNVLFGQKLTDEATCYKLFKTDLLKSLPLACEGFEFCPEATALVSRQGIIIPEIPISYAPRTASEGKKINWRDGAIAVWTLFRLRVFVSSSWNIALFIGLFSLFVYSLTWYQGFMGYEQETAESAILLARGDYQIFRAGVGAVLLYLPFVWLGQLLNVADPLQFLAVVPVFYSAAIPGVAYLVLNKLSTKTSANIITAILIAVATLLWPYSRIGMEYQTTLLILLLLLSLLSWKEKNVSPLLAGALLGYLALTKSYGILFAFPVLLFVLAALKESYKAVLSPIFLSKLFGPLALAVAAPVMVNLAIYGKTSGAYFLGQEFQVWSWWEGIFGSFFSFGKSLILYNPLLVVALFFWPKFYRKFPATSAFTLSSFLMLFLLTAPFSFWSDETLSVRKLVPITPLLHLPLIFIFNGLLKPSIIKKLAVAAVAVFAVYFQFINSIYPYWRQLEFLRPYNLDNLTIIRYSPRVSHLALHHAWFVSYVKNKFTGEPAHFSFLERSWMRCCTEPRMPDPVLARIDTSLTSWHKPDIFMLNSNQPQQRNTALGIEAGGILLSGGWLLLNIINHRKIERRAEQTPPF